MLITDAFSFDFILLYDISYLSFGDVQDSSFLKMIVRSGCYFMQLLIMSCIRLGVNDHTSHDYLFYLNNECG